MHRWILLGVLGVAMLVTVFDTALLGVAITQLIEDLNTDVTSVQLITTTFALTIGAFLLASGKIGDTIGRRTVTDASIVTAEAVSASGEALNPPRWFLNIGSAGSRTEDWLPGS